MEEDGRLVQFIYNHRGEVITEESGEAGLIRYIRGLGIVSSDSEQAKTYYHYVCDYAGSTSHVMNEQGNVENEYLYDAFGNITASAENVSNRFCYTGEQYDRIPNQYYLRARYYNPVIGRFTQQDTYLGAGLNLYAYCEGNPLSYVDPSGHTQQSAGDNAQDYTNLPSFQRMMAERKEGENKYIDGQLQVMSNLLDGEKSPQTTALMNVPQPGDLLPVVYQPFDYGALIKTGGDDGKPVATQSTAPDDSYNAVPFRNDAGTDSGTNPLDTAQRSAVAEAVSDAGGGETSYGKSSEKNKTGPKPKGTGPHNLKIEEIASQVTDGQVIAGGGVFKERVIPTPNGIKSSRRPDILVQKPDGSLYGINVGKTTANGAPIKREVEAIYDLEDAGIPMYFVPYDK